MTTHESGRRSASRHLAIVHRGAITVAFVSGTLALVAMLVGSALQIGSALAVCAAGWIVVHISEQFAAQQRASAEHLRKRSALTTRGQRVVFGPSRQRVSYPDRRFGSISIA